MKKHLIFLLTVMFSVNLFSQTHSLFINQDQEKSDFRSVSRSAMKEFINYHKVKDFQIDRVEFMQNLFNKDQSSKVNLGDNNIFNPDKSSQCTYVFRALDSYGDGWNGALMQIKQNGVVISTIGSGFSQGTFKDYNVTLTSGQGFEVFWSAGGTWPQECGLRITDPNGIIIYNQIPIGQSKVNTVFFSSVADCTPPLCPKPSSLQTNNLTTQSAQLSWIENGSATSWQIEWGLSNFVQGTGNLINTAAKPLTLNGLTENTYYKFFVRSFCNPLYSDWVGPVYFKTTCSNFTVPYFENFQNFQTNWCWTAQDVDGGGETWSMFNMNGDFSIVHSFSTNGYYEDGIIYSPNIILPNVLGLKLEFWSYNYDANQYGQNSLRISSNNWVTSQVLWAPASVSEQTWQKTVIDISAYKGSTIQFAFRYQGTNAHTWLVDSVSIYEGIPEKILDLKLLVQGLYSSTLPGTMRQASNSNGSEFVSDIADIITIELRDSANPNIIHYQKSNVLLTKNGMAVVSDIPFHLTESYYVVVKHRNSLETWSAAPLHFGSAGMVSYNFSDNANKAFGSNMKNMGNNYYAFYTGDINQDGIIDGVDMSLLDNASSQFLTGYLIQDLNGDGIIDSIDMSLIDNNIGGFIQIKRP